MEKISGIYKITMGDRYYVGRSTDVNGRGREHLSRLRRGCHENSRMQRTFDKYRLFEHTLVEECSPDDTPRVEARYLHLHADDPLCMNLASADENGVAFLASETRHKMSRSRTGRVQTEATRRKLSLAHAGKTLSPEHCHNLSLSRRGRVRTQEHRRKHAEAIKRPCVLFTPEGLPMHFNGIGDAAEYFGVALITISKRLKGLKPWPKLDSRRRTKLAGWTGEYVR